MALVITTYTVTQTGCVFTAPALSGMCTPRGARDHLGKRLYPNGNILFRTKKVNEWHCVVSNKCTKSDTTVIKLTLKNIYLVWESHFQFMAYSTAGMGVQ